MKRGWISNSNHTAATDVLNKDTGYRSYCQGGIFLETDWNVGILGAGNLSI